MFLAKYDDKIINIQYRNVYQINPKSTREIIIDFAIHQLSGPLISTIKNYAKHCFNNEHQFLISQWCDTVISKKKYLATFVEDFFQYFGDRRYKL